MNFEKALEGMRDSLAVGRAAWCDGDNVFQKTIGIKDGNIYLYKARYPMMPEHGIKAVLWEPKQEDILAEDWSFCTAKVSA